MERIAFWSLYETPKRTDLLVETVEKLIAKREKVCVIDVNVNSPELFRKLKPFLGKGLIGYPLVEYLLHSQDLKRSPARLEDYVVESDNLCYIGSTYESLYYAGKLLSGLDWTKLFPTFMVESHLGSNTVIQLMDRLKEKYSPNYILLNTPPGLFYPSIELSDITSDKWFCLRSNDPGEEELFNQLKKSTLKREKRFPSETFSKLIFEPEDILK